jgi:peroxiredoxin Q/BCP
MKSRDLQGKKAPAFCLFDSKETKHCLRDFAGKWLILYFYPKDDTPGCTVEACEFSASLPDFSGLDGVVVGISPDSTQSHSKFEEKHKLQILLLSDPEKKILEKYGVWQLKKNYGREFWGVARCTFLIEPKGKIRKVWEDVKVKDHVQEVKRFLMELRK